MGKYLEFVYNPSSVTYGLDLVVSEISVSSGPSTGGQSFAIRGESFGYDGLDDYWTGSTLDSTKWTDISSGTGSIDVGSPNLSLTTGVTAGSVAGVESILSMTSSQFEVKVSVPSVTSYPVSSVSLFVFELYVDASNYCRFAINQGTSSGTTTLDVTVYVGGKIVDSISTSWTTGVSVLKMLKSDTDVYFFSNGDLLFRTKRFISTAATWKYYSTNTSASYNIVSTLVEYTKLKTFVSFDSQIVHDPTVVSSTRLRGSTPPSIDERDRIGAKKGFVDVSVTCQNTATRSNFYEYYFEDNLVLLNSAQFDVKLSITDDLTVRTPSNISKGLGGGR